MLCSPQKYLHFYLFADQLLFKMDALNNFPTLCFEYVFLHKSYPKIRWLRMAVMWFYFSQICGLTGQFYRPNKSALLVAPLWWLGLSLHVVFHVGFSIVVSDFWEGKTQMHTHLSNLHLNTFVDVLLAKVRYMAKSRVQVGEDYPGQDFWVVWLIISQSTTTPCPFNKSGRHCLTWGMLWRHFL